MIKRDRSEGLTWNSFWWHVYPKSTHVPNLKFLPLKMRPLRDTQTLRKFFKILKFFFCHFSPFQTILRLLRPLYFFIFFLSVWVLTSDTWKIFQNFENVTHLRNVFPRMILPYEGGKICPDLKIIFCQWNVRASFPTIGSRIGQTVRPWRPWRPQIRVKMAVFWPFFGKIIGKRYYPMKESSNL